MSNHALLDRVHRERLAGSVLTEERQAALLEAVRSKVTAEFRPAEMLAPDDRVRVRYQVPHFLGFLGLPPLVVTGEAEGRQEGW